jgi:hypothetical protein
MGAHWQAPARITKLKGKGRAFVAAQPVQLTLIQGDNASTEAVVGYEPDDAIIEGPISGTEPDLNLEPVDQPLPINYTSAQGEASRNITPLVPPTQAVGASGEEKRVDSGVSGVAETVKPKEKQYNSPDGVLVVGETFDTIVRDFGASPEERPVISRIGPDEIDYDPKVKDFAYHWYIWEDKYALIKRPPRPVSWFTTIKEHLRQFEHMRENAHYETEGRRRKKESDLVWKAHKKTLPPPPTPPMLLVTTIAPEADWAKSVIDEFDETFLMATNPEVEPRASDYNGAEMIELSTKRKKLIAKQRVEDEPKLIFSPEGTDVYLGSCVPGFRHLRMRNTNKGPTLPMGLRVPILDGPP